jgi:redox-sensitive bicupin YhaK (pirin superfamily)
MTTNLLINERTADIGGFKVGRLLPVREKRQVGPITFLDHMGPAKIGIGKYMDVDQHPHIGLSTLTYLFEGSLQHKDSLGSVQLVTPGDVGFMTAGKGITHTERTPSSMRDGKTYQAHGYQVWIALPKDKEEMEPEFDFAPKEALPKKAINGLHLTLLAGEGFAMTSPVQVHSPLFIVDVTAEENAVLDLDGQLQGEIAIAVAEGQFRSRNEVFKERQMLISTSISGMKLEISKGSRLLMLGGQPLVGPRYLLWNFVSSSKERLQQAKKDWISKRFPEVPGDNTYVPIP